MRITQYRQSKGFTLIELIIVVAIIGILSVVAYGFYGENVISSNRTEGRTGLQTAAATLEKCKSLYGGFDAANCSYADFVTETGLYSITGVINQSTFTLTATPVAGTSQAGDTDCTTITLTNTGIKNGTGADVTECW